MNYRLAVILTTVSWAAVAPRFLHEGTNIVTETYRLAAMLFFHQTDPYVLPLIGGDRYEYSPFFCVFYGPFAALPLKIQALVWGFFNAFVFWLGVTKWTRLGKNSAWYVWVGFLLCSMELNISLLYQQSNAILIGLSLLGLADYRDGKWLRAGMVLALAANLKIYPGLFVFLLLFPPRVRFFQGIAISILITVLGPALFVGFSSDFSLHRTWLVRLFQAATYQREDLDIASVFTRLGAPTLGHWLKLSIAAGLVALGLRHFWKKGPEWMRTWIVLAMTGLLLINPRSESPTFVLLAPAYILLSQFAFDSTHRSSRWIVLGLVYIAAFLTTFVFTDVWPKGLWDPGTLRYGTKTLGALILWAIAVYWIFKQKSVGVFKLNAPRV